MKRTSYITRFFLAAALVIALGAVAFFVTRQVTPNTPVEAEIVPGPPQEASIALPWPDFRNKVLHWQSLTYVYSPSGPDHANGQEISGDIWVHVGSDNTPIAIRGKFTHKDGSFHQEYLVVDGTEFVVFDEIPLPADAPVAISCRQETKLEPTTFAKLVDTGEPLFADPAKLQSLGFSIDARPPSSVPDLPDVEAGATPENVVGDGPAAAVWVKETLLESGDVQVFIIEVDAESSLVQADTHLRNGVDGAIVRRQRLSTPVEVFAAEGLAASLFRPETLAECDTGA